MKFFFLNILNTTDNREELKVRQNLHYYSKYAKYGNNFVVVMYKENNNGWLFEWQKSANVALYPICASH